MLTVIIYAIIIKLIINFPSIELINWENSLNKITWLVLNSASLVSLFLMFESIWSLGILNITGMKNLFAKNKEKFHLDFIKKHFIIKGPYQRHRHPFLFYSFPFIIFILASFTTTNLLALILLSIYYTFYARMIESQLQIVFTQEFIDYQTTVSFFIPKLKKYSSDGSTKK
jgi:protein-S-isoprenylcysteine O-methyltransferase Ste14